MGFNGQSMVLVEEIHVSKTFGDGDEKQVADEQDIRGQDGFFQIAPLVTQVHKYENDVCGFDEGQDNKGPFDHDPREGIRALEINAHRYFKARQNRQYRCDFPGVPTDFSTFLLAVMSVQGVVVVDYEIVAFHEA